MSAMARAAAARPRIIRRPGSCAESIDCHEKLRGAPLSGALGGPAAIVRTRSAASGRAGWADALQKLSSQLPALGALLQLFSAGVRYAETRDEGVLLELPLEQRRLLLDEVSKTPSKLSGAPSGRAPS